MQDDDEITYAVKLLGSFDHPSHIQCEDCREIKPRASFEYRCSQAQAEALGRSQPFDFVSRYCKPCRKKREKPLSKLSLKEIQNRITSGRIKGGAIGALIKANRVADGIKRKREASYRRWKNARLEIWEQMFDESNHEYARARKNKSLNKPDTQLHAFFTAYCQAIVEVRGLFKLEGKRGSALDKGKIWWHYMGAGTRARLYEMWEAIPFVQRHALKTPEIFEGLNQLTKGEPQ